MTALRLLPAGVASIALLAPAAYASPWIVDPSFSLSSEYQSNPSYSPSDPRSSTQGAVGFSMPAAWQEGRWSTGLGASGQLRRGSGNASASDASDFALQVEGSRGGDRTVLGFSAGATQTNLLGGTTSDVGLNRSGGFERNYSAGGTATWLMSEYDSLGASATWAQRSFEGSPDSGFVASSNSTATLSYSRALSPRLQALGLLARQRFAPENDGPTSIALSYQVGVSYQPLQFWSLRATAGRSRVRSEFLGVTIPGSVYDVSVSRRTELGNLSFAATQGFDSSAFATVTRRQTYSLSYSRPITPRLGAALSAGVSEANEVFDGARVRAQRSSTAALSLAYSLTEVWMLGGSARYTRESYPVTLLRAAQPSADSTAVAVSLARKFGSIPLFR